ncbi:MAG: tetratricopeptide repeat protein [Candidatus Zixiibacteriota bacterium]
MSKTNPKATAIFLGYTVTLIIFFVGSSYLSGRVWGIDIWIAAPGAFPLLTLGIAVGALIWFLPPISILSGTESTSAAGHTYVLLSAGLIVILTLAFYFFRAQTHFLGDGYTLLSLLGADTPLIKQREIGEALIHVWVKNLLGLSGGNGALKAFQAVSIMAGALYVLAAIAGASRLFERNTPRVLFVLGVICAGNAPLFFGYVENYSVFAVSVLLVTLLGALSLSGALSKFWTIPALVFSVWLHTLGLTLVPGVVYVLVKDTRLARLLSNLALRWRLALAGATLALFGAAFLYFHQSNVFLEAALLSITPSRFTVEGYTLFSVKHLLDYSNLLMLLCPWALVAPALVFSRRRKTNGAGDSSPAIRFLVILSVSTVSAVFLFDPKLGMPRDWDLFSFAAIPVTVLFYSYLLKSKIGSPVAVRTAALSVTLSLLALIPRVSASVNEQVSVKRIETFIELDEKKNRTALQLLQKFHAEQGDTAAVAALGRRYSRMYPEVALTRRATKLGQGGKMDSAFALLHEALSINPMYAPAYLNLGRARRAQESYDSALYYLEIADGLNPYNEFIRAELGLVHQELGDLYLRQGNLESARAEYRRAVEMGMDSSLLSR